MKTIEITLYKFAELSVEAQKKAIESQYDINTSYDWWDGVYEDAKQIGLNITGFDIDRSECNGDFTLSANEVAANILAQHGETCETYKTAGDFMKAWQPVFDTYMESEEGESELIEIENDFLNSLLEDYRIMLRKEYEYLTSEEAIKETIEANEYDFTEDGKMY